MKPLSEMSKKELLAYAGANKIILSSATRLSRVDLERAVRKMMQQGNRTASGGPRQTTSD